jgi:hypothetical protein
MAVAAIESAAPSAFLSISCWSDMYSSVNDGCVLQDPHYSSIGHDPKSKKQQQVGKSLPNAGFYPYEKPDYLSVVFFC